MKITKFNSAYIWALCTVVALSATVMNSCSSDDDYDLYQGDELKTYAAVTRAGSESSGTSNSNDNSEYMTDVDNCGGVVLAQLHYANNTDGCASYAQAYSHVKKLADNNCSNMTPERIIEVSQKVGVNFTGFYRVEANSDSAEYYIGLLDKVYNKVFIYQKAAASSEHTGLHAAIGKEFSNRSSNKSKWHVDVYDSKDGTSITSVSLNKIIYIIY